MAVDDFVITDVFYHQNLFEIVTRISCLRKFQALCNDFLTKYGKNIVVLNRTKFEIEMVNLGLKNDNLEKINNGYYYKHPVVYMFKRAKVITCFFDATAYVGSALRRRKRLFSGIVSMLKLGGVVRLYNQDFCYNDIKELKKILGNKSK